MQYLRRQSDKAHRINTAATKRKWGNKHPGPLWKTENQTDTTFGERGRLVATYLAVDCFFDNRACSQLQILQRSDIHLTKLLLIQDSGIWRLVEGFVERFSFLIKRYTWGETSLFLPLDTAGWVCDVQKSCSYLEIIRKHTGEWQPVHWVSWSGKTKTFGGCWCATGLTNHRTNHLWTSGYEI